MKIGRHKVDLRNLLGWLFGRPACMYCGRDAVHAHPDGGSGGLCEDCFKQDSPVRPQ
jgi:hypothetical protein